MPDLTPPTEEEGASFGSLDRIIQDAFFPSSPAATTREAILSDLLSEILGARPKADVDDLIESLRKSGYLGDEVIANLAVDAFNASYTIVSRGVRGETKRKRRDVVPFHPVIAKTVKPEESRSWGKWYLMLMTKGDPPVFNRDLHIRFVDRLNALQPSNIYESILVNAAENLVYESTTKIDQVAIKPYVPGLCSCFQEDLEAWISDSYESPSRWLQACGDLVCYYIMMTIVQTSVNLRVELEHARVQPGFTPEVRPIYFGLVDEKASGDRKFSTEWSSSGPRGIEGDIYDSWGRLVVLRMISGVSQRVHAGRFSPRITEVLQDEELRGECEKELGRLLAERGISPASSELIDLAEDVTNGIRDYYEGKVPQNQTPRTMGINVVLQLGEGQTRKYISSQRSIGVTFRLDPGSLVLFARLFTRIDNDKPFDNFILYLRRRGIELDEVSKRVVLERLTEMGMISKQSDSEEALYVRTL